MSRLNNQHNAAICPTGGHGANTVFVLKVKNAKANETLIDNLSFRSTFRSLLLELMFNKKQ